MPTQPLVLGPCSEADLPTWRSSHGQGEVSEQAKGRDPWKGSSSKGGAESQKRLLLPPRGAGAQQCQGLSSAEGPCHCQASPGRLPLPSFLSMALLSGGLSSPPSESHSTLAGPPVSLARPWAVAGAGRRGMGRLGQPRSPGHPELLESGWRYPKRKKEMRQGWGPEGSLR